MSTDEMIIRDLIEQWAAAVHEGDLGAVLAHHVFNWRAVRETIEAFLRKRGLDLADALPTPPSVSVPG